METYYRRSITTNRKYNVFDPDILRILNCKQACFYVSKGCDMLNVQLSKDKRTGEPVFVYLFFREDTKEAYDEWCKRKDQISIS